MGVVSQAVVHHTPGQDPAGYDQAVAEMRAILAGHLANSWGDIGYTWVVWDRYAFEARGFGRTGAHAPGVNSSSIGIAYLLDGRYRLPTAVEWATGRDIMARAGAEGYATPGYTVSGHRDHVATECPGGLVYAALGDWWADPGFGPAETPPETEPAPVLAPAPRRSIPMDLEIRRDAEGNVVVGPPDFGHTAAVVYYDAPLAPTGARVAVAPRRPGVPNFQASAVVTPLVEDDKLDPPAGVRPLDWSGWGRPAVFSVASDSYVTIVVDARCTPDQVRAVLV